MFLSDLTFNIVNYIYIGATIYFVTIVLSKFWLLITEYVLPLFKQPQNLKIYGQWAVITGSTDGIGKGFALELASKGLDICLISRNEEKLQNTAKEIEDKFGVKVKYIVADFTNTKVYDNIKENLTEIDIGILVNNVGMVSNKGQKSFSRYNGEFVRETLNVNVLTAPMMTSIVAPSMIAKRRGLILNISSVAGEIITPYMTVYSSSKAFMTMFGACLSSELKRHNIQVKTLSPGFVLTNMATKDFNIGIIGKIFPSAVITVPKFVKSALRSLNSGNNKSCGYLAHEIYLMLWKTLPLEGIGFFLSLFHKPARKRKP